MTNRRMMTIVWNQWEREHSSCATLPWPWKTLDRSGYRTKLQVHFSVSYSFHFHQDTFGSACNLCRFLYSDILLATDFHCQVDAMGETLDHHSRRIHRHVVDEDVGYTTYDWDFPQDCTN